MRVVCCLLCGSYCVLRACCMRCGRLLLVCCLMFDGRC